MNDEMNKKDKAVNTFLRGFRCSQSILSTYAADLGLDKKIALRLAAPFCSGICRLGNTCGAVTGALMVLGLKYGHTEVSDENRKEKSYTIA